MLQLIVAGHVALLRLQNHASALLRERRDRGQTTAEYALVLLGVAAVALLVMAWAADTNRISKLLDKVLDSMIGKIT